MTVTNKQTRSIFVGGVTTFYSNECGNCKKTNNLTTMCKKCNSVIYCNGSCMKAHRKKHEKDCARNVRNTKKIVHERALQKKKEIEVAKKHEKDCQSFTQKKKIDVTLKKKNVVLQKKEIELAKKAWAKGLQQRKEDEEKKASMSALLIETNRAAPQSKKESVDKDDYESKMILFQKQDEAWQRVSKFVLGEGLTAYCTPAGSYIRDMLQALLTTIKNGCCSNVGPGYMCGHCESSVDVIYISRAIILSICKLPLKLDDDISRRELDRMRSWVCNQSKEFKDDSGDDNEIIAVLPQKLRGLIVRLKDMDWIDIQPPWGEDDFGILLQQPSPSWIVRVNLLMLMGYKVELVNFNDVARFSRKDLTVVHDGISRLLCHSDNGDDKVNEINGALNKSCTLKNSKETKQVDDGSSPSRQWSKIVLSEKNKSVDRETKMIGDRLYPLIHQTQPELAEKITGMLLEKDNKELVFLLDSPEALNAMIQEALQVLKDHALAEELRGVSEEDKRIEEEIKKRSRRGRDDEQWEKVETKKGINKGRSGGGGGGGGVGKRNNNKSLRGDIKNKGKNSNRRK